MEKKHDNKRLWRNIQVALPNDARFSSFPKIWGENKNTFNYVYFEFESIAEETETKKTDTKEIENLNEDIVPKHSVAIPNPATNNQLLEEPDGTFKIKGDVFKKIVIFFIITTLILFIIFSDAFKKTEISDNYIAPEIINDKQIIIVKVPVGEEKLMAKEAIFEIIQYGKLVQELLKKKEAYKQYKTLLETSGDSYYQKELKKTQQTINNKDKKLNIIANRYMAKVKKLCYKNKKIAIEIISGLSKDYSMTNLKSISYALFKKHCELNNFVIGNINKELMDSFLNYNY